MDSDRDCPIYSPTRFLPMWQFRLNDINVSGDVDVELETYPDKEFQQSLSGIEIVNTDDGDSYITYTGSDLVSGTPPGLYRVRVRGGNITGEYNSHVLCLSPLFNPQDWQPSIACDTASGGGLEFEATFDFDPGLPTEVEVNYGTVNGWQRIGDGVNDTPVFYSAQAVADSVRLRFKVWLNDALFYKEYLYTFDPDAETPCDSGVLTLVNTGGQGFERFLRLQWTNVKDLVALGLQYSNVVGSSGYLQQFYFEGWASLAGVSSEEEFLENGIGERVLDSVKVARLYNIDFYPMPDGCIAPITAANYHDTKQLIMVCDGWSAAASAIQFTPNQPEGAPCAGGTLGIELDRVLVGCQDNLGQI